ncbi:SpaA isopeptide-forming pilin-related protein [Streptomyces sp. NPDC096310]|uniref:SpaA isopeptide-forming pilin-related protein n=1 Tax=Streptomyces sp. NPDC096310 TaxID=3366082 RepID=UPI00380F8D00
MHARLVRGTVRSAALAAVVTSTLPWAPTAVAQSAEPTPAPSTAPGDSLAAEAGRVVITKKDPAGDLLAGASFLLLDADGQEAGRGTTDPQGKLTFPDLAPGVYRLKETASGSPHHEVVADQDIIVTPGAATRLTITDPFKAAKILLQTKDHKTGKLLPGSTVNIGTGSETLLTLTTGSQGTATGELPVTSRRIEFWARQVTAPEGYGLYKPAKTFTAGPGAPVTVTLTNAKSPTTAPSIDPSDKPTHEPTHQPTDTLPPHKPGDDNSPTAPQAPSAPTPTPDKPTASTWAPTPSGALANTGADTAPWVLGGAGLLIVVGGALIATRRRTDDAADDSSTEN